MTAAPSILIVDDDADIRDTLAEALLDEGYRVAVASNGKEALRVLRSTPQRPDVILLDIMMPEMDGWAFRAEQRKDPELAEIPVLVFTAHGAPKDVAQQLGAAGYVNKPLRFEDLLSAIERVRLAPKAPRAT